MQTPDLPIRLGDLIDVIDTSADDALHRVTNAVRLADDLGNTADSLIGHFVDQARRAGASWADIGRSMGTSKQAAQKRFVAKPKPAAEPMDSGQGFSRFREDARAVVIAAQDRARAAANDSIGINHLVLGLVGTPGMAMLAMSGFSLQEIERIAAATLPPAAETVPALIPFDAHAKAALEGAFAQAQRRGSEGVGSEHLLLAVLVAEAGTGVLAGLGLTAKDVDAVLDEEEA